MTHLAEGLTDCCKRRVMSRHTDETLDVGNRSTYFSRHLCFCCQLFFFFFFPPTSQATLSVVGKRNIWKAMKGLFTSRVWLIAIHIVHSMKTRIDFWDIGHIIKDRCIASSAYSTVKQLIEVIQLHILFVFSPSNPSVAWLFHSRRHRSLFGAAPLPQVSYS